jgi:hypothetical protein
MGYIYYLCIINLKIGDIYYGNENQDYKSPYGKGKKKRNRFNRKNP